ncbi:MAG: YggT family protein [Actinobacteria bacterium]|nr:MAG: YggT family protein [Actinomycetota bacterium]
MSWFRPTGTMWEIYHVLGKVCEPYLGLFRRFVPSMGGLDFSPMIALLVLSYGGSMIARLLAGLGV